MEIPNAWWDIKYYRMWIIRMSREPKLQPCTLLQSFSLGEGNVIDIDDKPAPFQQEVPLMAPKLSPNITEAP